MLVYEKKVNGQRHLFGTLGNIPADADVQLTYKDAEGAVITPVDKDTYLDNKRGGIIRKSDAKAVNVFIGDTCIIGEDVNPVASKPVVKPVEKKVETVKPVEKKAEVKPVIKEEVKEEAKEEAEADEE